MTLMGTDAWHDETHGRGPDDLAGVLAAQGLELLADSLARALASKKEGNHDALQQVCADSALPDAVKQVH